MRRIKAYLTIFALSLLSLSCGGGTETTNTTNTANTNTAANKNATTTTTPATTASPASTTATPGLSEEKKQQIEAERKQWEASVRANAEEQGCKVGTGSNDPYFWVAMQSGLSQNTEDLRGTSIYVDVENGVITLRGLVVTPAQKEIVEKIAKHISNRGVRNALAISPNAPEVARKIASMKSGNIAFDVPTSMYVQDTISAFLLLSATESPKALENKIAEMNKKGTTARSIKEAQRQAHIETAEVQFSGFMEAKLVGPGFEITPITPERQIVNNTQEAKWRWDIKAKDPGEQHLHLTMNAVFKIEGSEQLYLVQVFDKVITVNVSWRTWAATFVGNNWQWLWTVVVGPLVLAIWRHRKKKEAEAPSWEKP